MEDFLSERTSPIERAAAHLVDASSRLIDDLRKARIDTGLSHGDIAGRMGVSAEHVAELESYWSDPRLSELRRYALAIGVLIDFEVTPADLSEV